MSDRAALIALFARHSYQEGDFVLSSGKESHFYLDAKQVSYRAEGVQAIGRAILKLLHDADIEAVGGLTLGADAIVSSVVWASTIQGPPIDGFVVRKEAKQHGLQKWIEGVFPAGKRVAIVDDVITSGSSVLKAVKIAREANASVELVIGLIDREQGGAQAIEAAGVKFLSLCKLSEIQEHATAPLNQNS